jgi:hypothetical protein
MACKLAPQVVPVGVMAAVAEAELVFVGVKVAVALQTSPAFKVTAASPPSPDALSPNSGFDGVPIVKVAAAFPVFCRLNEREAGTPTAVAGNAREVGPPATKASVAPVAIADKGIWTWAWAGSFVKRLREPINGASAGAELGTVALTVKASDLPGSTLSVAGLTENPLPVVAAETASASDPLFRTVHVSVWGVPPHEAAGKVNDVAEKAALAPPSVLLEASCPASGGSWCSEEPSCERAPPSVSAESSPPQLAVALAKAMAVTRDPKVPSPFLRVPPSRLTMYNALRPAVPHAMHTRGFRCDLWP